jgi:MFS family permease
VAAPGPGGTSRVGRLVRRDLQRLPLYLGGLMGPFGTMVILPMFPELRETFDASSGAVGWGFTIYFIPFAIFLLASGTLGERWGRRRTVRATFLLYAGASIVCALAPNLTVFLIGRGIQGLANAFITPLLLAGLADIVPADRFGRSVGIYGTFQALGGGIAPIVGGLAAEVDWRWAFVAAALLAATLAIWPPPGGPRTDVEAPPVRPLFTRRMVTLGFSALAAASGPMGVAVIVGVAARDELNLSAPAAGALLFGGSAAATMTSPLWGRLFDSWGPRRMSAVVMSTVSVLAGALAFTTNNVALMAMVWAVTGMFVSASVVAFQGIAATAVPANRGGALSATLSYRFLGHAIGPVVWLAVFELSPQWAFLGSASLGVIAVAGLLAVTGTRFEPADPV